VSEKLLLGCSCACSVLQLYDLREFPAEGDWNEQNALTVSYLAHPHTLRDRLQHAWKALCGAEFCYHETLVELRDVHLLRRWLERYEGGAGAPDLVTTITPAPMCSVELIPGAEGTEIVYNLGPYGGGQ